MNSPLKVHLRPAERADFPRVVELSNMFDTEAITVEILERREQERHPEAIWQRMVAFDEEGHVLGFSFVLCNSWDPSDTFFLDVAVDRRLHGRGIGSLLYENALQWAQKHQTRQIECWVRDTFPESLRFAKKRGFSIYRHHYESTLDLTSFDEARFAGVIEGLEAKGIRFFSLADLGDTREARRRYYESTCLLRTDVPGLDYPVPPFEVYEKLAFSSERYYADSAFVAAQGDKWIGLSRASYNMATHSMWNQLTAVDRAFRGRKIALALKLLVIRSAYKCGVAYLRTLNDSENAPMLAVNRRLGYQAQPGAYSLRCKL